MLTLVEPGELEALGVPELGSAVRSRGMDWRHLPVADYSLPTPAFERQWEKQGEEIWALSGGDILVHCKGGLGRAGRIAARLLLELGMPTQQAIREVRRVRKGAIETRAQEDLVRRTNAIPARPPGSGT